MGGVNLCSGTDPDARNSIRAVEFEDDLKRALEPMTCVWPIGSSHCDRRPHSAA